MRCTLVVERNGQALLLCHCKVVSDREVGAVIDQGARDEFDVAEACGAGSVCGGCVPAISAMLDARGCTARCPVGSALDPARATLPILDAQPLR